MSDDMKFPERSDAERTSPARRFGLWSVPGGQR